MLLTCRASRFISLRGELSQLKIFQTLLPFKPMKSETGSTFISDSNCHNAEKNLHTFMHLFIKLVAGGGGIHCFLAQSYSNTAETLTWLIQAEQLCNGEEAALKISNNDI